MIEIKTTNEHKKSLTLKAHTREIRWRAAVGWKIGKAGKQRKGRGIGFAGKRHHSNEFT